VDAKGKRVTLHEGMQVTAFDEDLDNHGNRDNLIASGIVEPSPEWLSCRGSRWVLRIDRHGVRHESEMRTQQGRPLALDPLAESSSPNEPAFIAKPAGAPVYHGFEVLSDVVVGGFTFGKITDFEIETCNEGDAFVIAPDNSRAGLVWEVSDKNYFHEVCAPEVGRWGVWGVAFPNPMTTRENVRKNLDAILPELRKRWEEWRRINLNK